MRLLSASRRDSFFEDAMNDLVWAVGFAVAAGILFKVGAPKLGTIVTGIALLGFVLAIGRGLGYRI